MFAVDDSNFNFFTNPKPLVMVVFWGQNCSACKLLEPAIIDLAQKYQDEMWVVTAEKSLIHEAAKKYDVRFLPTCIMFKDGQEIDRISGNQRYQVMEDFIKQGIRDDYLQRAC